MRNQMRVCSKPGCPNLCTGGRCPSCRSEAEAARGTSKERGYDEQHKALRAKLLRRLRQDERDGKPAWVCRKCGLPMLSTQPLQLGHAGHRALDIGQRADELEHQTCNSSDGGRLGAMITNSR